MRPPPGRVIVRCSIAITDGAHGRHRADQPEVRNFLLGSRTCAAVRRQARQHAGGGAAAARRADPRPAHRHHHRRERRADRLRALRARRHRRRHRHDRAAPADARGADRAQAPRRVHRGRRPVDHGQGGLLRRTRRRDVHRRGGGDLAGLPRRLGGGPCREALRAGGQDRSQPRAGAAARPDQDEPLRLRQHPVLARLSVPLRVLRHHRGVRAKAAAQDRAADHRRAGGPARAEPVVRLHRRRQPDRQQEGDQGRAAPRHRLAARRTAIRCASSPRPRSISPTMPS